MVNQDGQVISCRSVEHWRELCDTGNEANKLVVVQFAASWCGACRLTGPLISDLAQEFHNAMFIKVDIDDIKPVTEEWNVKAIPTFIFQKDGKEIDRIMGSSIDRLSTALDKHATPSSA